MTTSPPFTPDDMTAWVSSCCPTVTVRIAAFAVEGGEDEGALRTPLQRADRDHDRILQGLDLETDVDEDAGPQLQLRVLEVGLQLHGAGRRVDRVVDDGEHAMVDRLRAVRVESLHVELIEERGLVDPRQILLRHVEDHADRLNLRDRDDPGRVGGVDEVADIDVADAGPAGDGRGDVGIAQRRLRAVDQRLVDLHLRHVLRDDGDLGIGLLLGAGLLRGEQLVAREITPGVQEGGLVQGFLRDVLIEGRLIEARIDLGDDGAGLDVLPLNEVQRQQHAVDLRADQHGIERLAGADAFDIDRDVGLSRDRGQNRDDSVPRGAAFSRSAGLSGRLCLCRSVEHAFAEGGHQEHGDDRDPADPGDGAPQTFHARFTSSRWATRPRSLQLVAPLTSRLSAVRRRRRRGPGIGRPLPSSATAAPERACPGS